MRNVLKQRYDSSENKVKNCKMSAKRVRVVLGLRIMKTWRDLE